MQIAERDVIVVGAGNAATCAALSARENGASVLMLEIAPQDAACGNSAFTGGAFRIVYHGFDDLAALIPDMSDHELAQRRCRHLHRRAILRRCRAPHRMALRPRPHRNPHHPELRDRQVDALQGGAVSARPRPPGVPGRRQVQVLGRARLPHLGRRQGADEGAARDPRARGHPGLSTRPRRWPCSRATTGSRASASACPNPRGAAPSTCARRR